MQDFQEQALAFLKGEMNAEERQKFEDALSHSADLRNELQSSRQLLDLLEAASEEAMARRVNHQIEEAISLHASDIHLLGERDSVVATLRIDGQLHELERYSKDWQQPLVDQWKILATTNVNERQLSQDGRFPLRHNDHEYDLRVSFIPTIYGERVTARILDRSHILIGLDQLGLSTMQQTTLERLAALPSGFIFTSGPTGSGTTTLLYSLIKQMLTSKQPRRNILTIEDPVEVVLDGASQIVVNQNAGMTVSHALRACMRADPDVVMVSEIRSLETAELMTELALTGHLVLSIMHPSAALLIPQRLREMGVVSPLIAQTVQGLIGQRLARRICPDCAVEYTPSAQELRFLGLTANEGTFRRGAGCQNCRQTGYRGRIALFEIIEVNETLRRLIAEEAPLDALWKEAFGGNSGSLRDDAREKVRQGVTTFEEVARVLFDYPDPIA